VTEPLYKMQRKLSKKRLSAVKHGLIGLIDIGTSKVVCFILRFTPEKDRQDELRDSISLPKNVAFRIIGAATTRSRGVAFGDIESMEEVEKAIRTVVQAAQKMAGVLLEDVLVSFSGGDPKSYGVTGITKVSSREVSEFDIGNALINSDVPDYGLKREVIHALPVNFSLDEKTGLIDPRGQLGNELSVDLHLMTVNQSTVHNVIHAVKKCHLDLSGLSFAPYLAGISSLTEDELQLGAACIDLGAGISGVTIFLRKQMIYGGSVKLGGMHITSDIMKAFNISFETAERIKTLHGGVVSTSRDDRDLIEITREADGHYEDRTSISRSELIGVIRPRVEEILEELRDELMAAGFDKLRGNKKIILTGGACQLPGLFDVASKILDSAVRIGKPIRIQGLPHATNGPEFAASIGLALHAGHPQDECWDFQIPFGRSGFTKINGIFKWFAENW
jgi:cell division protein FtsA